MISWSSVWAITLRHLRLWKRDHNQLFDNLYWPVLDVLTWGFLGQWIAQTQACNLPNYQTVALLGVLLWIVVARGCNIVVSSFCEEIWAKNIVNLFSLPLRLSEWIIGIILLMTILVSCTSLCCIVVAALFYDVAFYYLLSEFLIFWPPLILCGLWLGFTCLQILVTLGQRGMSASFAAGWFLLPFSGAYYPIEVLPGWAQKISSVVPMSYIFQGMRQHVMFNQNPTPYLVRGYLLGGAYAAGAIALFVYCFRRSKDKGLARLAD